MPRRFVLFLFACSGLVLCIVTSPAKGQFAVTGERSVSGTLVSLADNRLVIRDDAGQVHETRIQPHDEQAVPLNGGAMLRFPAEVQVTGRYPLDSLDRGQLLRVDLRLNRRGEVDGSVQVAHRISSEDQAEGVYPSGEPNGLHDFVACQVVGKFTRISKDRLLIQVPRNDFVRKRVLSVPVTADVEVRLETADHRAAAAGATVDEAVIASLNTGDQLIRKLQITMSADSTAQQKFDDQLELKYRHLSDDPVAPRLIRSRHFMIQTDISERQASILLEKLERMVGLLSSYFGARPTGLVQAFVVHDLAKWPDGMLAEPAGIAKIREGAGVCFSVRRGNQAQATVYSCDDHGVVQHESTHAFCTLTFGSTGPAWLAEGVAEMGQYWKSDETAVNINPRVLEYLRSARPKRTLGEIVRPGQTSAGGWQDYAWRWALCHLLANNPNYSERFKPLAIALMTGKEGASFAAAYGDLERQISFEYDQFLQTLDNGYDARLCQWQWNRRFAPVRGNRHTTAKVQAAYGWQATGAELASGERYRVTTTGRWQLSTKGEAVSADGDRDGRGRLIATLFHDFELSEPFELGTATTFVATQPGQLFVRCREAWHSLADNSGELQCQIELVD